MVTSLLSVSVSGSVANNSTSCPRRASASQRERTERLGPPCSSARLGTTWTSFKRLQDNGPRDYGTAGLRDHGTTGLWDKEEQETIEGRQELRDDEMA